MGHTQNLIGQVERYVNRGNIKQLIECQFGLITSLPDAERIFRYNTNPSIGYFDFDYSKVRTGETEEMLQKRLASRTVFPDLKNQFLLNEQVAPIVIVDITLALESLAMSALVRSYKFTNGIEVAEEIKKYSPKAHLMLFTALTDPESIKIFMKKKELFEATLKKGFRESANLVVERGLKLTGRSEEKDLSFTTKNK